MDILERQLADSVKAWRMEADGRYVRNRTNNAQGFRFQERFYETLQAEERGDRRNALARLMGMIF